MTNEDTDGEDNVFVVGRGRRPSATERAKNKFKRDHILAMTQKERVLLALRLGARDRALREMFLKSQAAREARADIDSASAAIEISANDQEESK